MSRWLRPEVEFKLSFQNLLRSVVDFQVQLVQELFDLPFCTKEILLSYMSTGDKCRLKKWQPVFSVECQADELTRVQVKVFKLIERVVAAC